MSKDPVTVYYDGACPICVRHRRWYQRLAGKDGDTVCWFDITGQEDRLRQIGIDPHKALTELHLQDPRGRIHSELDAYIVLLKKVPLLKPLALLIGLPRIRPALARLYRRMVLRRLRRGGRLG